MSKTRYTANVVSLDPDDPNSFRAFAPELAKTLARVPQVDPETQLYVEEVKPNLFYVTEGIYQSAFLKTGQGVIVLDAPPSFAHKLTEVIKRHASNEPIRYLVYSHGHADHVGGASVFGEVQDLQIVAPKMVAEAIREKGNPDILQPTVTFDDQYDFSLGDEKVELKTASFHSEDTDVIVYLPKQKFIMAVDTITPGEAPFMNFGATAHLGEYMNFFDQILAYDFELILSGHVSILGNRDDVIEAKEYVFDVRDTVLRSMETFLDRFNDILEAFEYQNANLAYRSAIESVRGECSAEIIERWKDRLSVVDVWADSHCEAMVLYYIMH
jgi:glyoxylase-like metal-dependent hydrolase (beta-lactamase superfamily II)